VAAQEKSPKKSLSSAVSACGDVCRFCNEACATCHQAQFESKSSDLTQTLAQFESKSSDSTQTFSELHGNGAASHQKDLKWKNHRWFP
jgi:hypothetical protein